MQVTIFASKKLGSHWKLILQLSKTVYGGNGFLFKSFTLVALFRFDARKSATPIYFSLMKQR